MGKFIIIATIAMCAWTQNASAYLLVEDIPNLTNAIRSELLNYAKFVQEVENQIQQIQQEAAYLEMFGNPNTYVGLLGLNDFQDEVAILKEGIGRTIEQFRQGSNGLAALNYTASGIYGNLQGMVDRFGNPVQFQAGNFRKFQTFNDMYDAYNTQQGSYNTQMNNLNQQLQTAMQNLNNARTQMETEKYAAQVNAIHAQMNALGHTTVLTGQRAAVQVQANQVDAARVAEAEKEQMDQERVESLEQEASGLSGLISGGSNGGNNTGIGTIP